MEFEFVVGRHSLTNGTESVIAGFKKLETAKDYADRKSEKNKWYAPDQEAHVFDASKDYVVNLDDLP